MALKIRWRFCDGRWTHLFFLLLPTRKDTPFLLPITFGFRLAQFLDSEHLPCSWLEHQEVVLACTGFQSCLEFESCKSFSVVVTLTRNIYLLCLANTLTLKVSIVMWADDRASDYIWIVLKAASRTPKSLWVSCINQCGILHPRSFQLYKTASHCSASDAMHVQIT